jgi:hypothetical protein
MLWPYGIHILRSLGIFYGYLPSTVCAYFVIITFWYVVSIKNNQATLDVGIRIKSFKIRPYTSDRLGKCCCGGGRRCSDS